MERKNFLFAGLSLAAVATFFKLGRQPEKRKNTAKFLTHDGKLVAIDIDKLPVAKRQASREDVQSWVNK